MRTYAWTATKPDLNLVECEHTLPELKPNEVCIKVSACGLCFSDLHLIRNDWKFSRYPFVPGHEIVGTIVSAGADVKNLATGTIVGVGWQSGSCMECEDCKAGKENLCDHSQATCVGHLGGFSEYHITSANFCFPLPEGLQGPEAAPLLCGGITVYSPLVDYANFPGARVGVVGLGGLGHLAVKMASKMGAEVTVFSSSKNKETEARSMGANHFISYQNNYEIPSQGRHLDLVLVTANVDLPWNLFLQTLRADGTLCFVGIPPSPMTLNVFELLGKQLKIAASAIGSRKKMQEMLEFCAKHGVRATSEIYPMDQINSVLHMVEKNQVRYRAVLVR